MKARNHISAPQAHAIQPWRWALRAALVLLLGAITIAQPQSPAQEATPATQAPLAIPAGRQADNIAILTIKGPIDAITAASMKRRIDQAITGGADAIVIDLDTPGGEVGAVLEICSMIKRASVPTYGWVNPTAYSGGAIIALACNEIILANGATMGDAAPVSGNPIQFAQGLQPTERQKILAPLLSEIVESARKNGYDEKLVQSLVSLGVELWYIEDTHTGEKYFVDEVEYLALFGEEPSRFSPHVASGSMSGAAEVPASEEQDQPAEDDEAVEDDQAAEGDEAEPSADEPAPAPTPAPVPPANSGRINQGSAGSDAEFLPGADSITQETIDTINLTIAEPSTRPDFSQADPSRYRLVHYATDGKTLLTLKEDDLKLYGFAEDTIENDEELKGYLGAKKLARLDQSWAESFVGVMTQGLTGLVIRGVLIVLFLLGMFIEMSMPGLGLPGGIAVLALLGLVIPPMLIGAASWWAGVVILGGIALIMLEIFVFPGFGVPGVLGLVLMLGGLVGTFAGAGEIFPGSATGDYSQTLYAVSITGVSLFIAIVGMFFFTKYTHKFPVIGGLILGETSGPAGSLGILEAMGDAPGHEHLRVGDRGESITTLRPSGTARFGDELIDVVAKLGVIDSGAPVRIAEIADFRIIVELASDGRGSATPRVPALPDDEPEQPTKESA